MKSTRMFRLCASAIFAIAASAIFSNASAAIIYQENFDGQEGKGAIGSTIDTSGVSWSIDLGAASLFNNNDFFAVKDGVFAAQDTNAGCSTANCSGEVSDPLPANLPQWFSPIIDVSGYTNLSIELFVGISATNFEASGGINSEDTFVFSTLRDGINNGPDAIIFDLLGLVGPTSGVIGGSIADTGTVQFRMTANTYANAEQVYFDNILLTGDAIAPTTPVPLPGTLALLAAGIAGMETARRRKLA